MTWTWGEIVSLALFRSGLVGAGQIPNGAATKQGFDCLELLLDEWDGEGLALPDYRTDLLFDTTSNVFKYWLGTGSETAAIPYRPEQIIQAEIQVNTIPNGEAVWLPLAPISYQTYRKQSVPSTQSQPCNYSVNQKWPQAEFYLYPNPNQVFTIRLEAKLKWAATVGDPTCSPCSEAEIPSGYTTALVDNLALKIAQNNRLETSVLELKAKKGRFLVTTYVQTQVPDLEDIGGDAFSWNIINAGRNP